jgi:sulfate adenylyltransferase subunit 2
MASMKHLDLLEAESIDIMREAVAESERAAMLYSVGKDSSAMLHLAMKAFHPAQPPFPLLHVETRWTLREIIEFRDAVVRELRLELLVHTDRQASVIGIDPFVQGSAYHATLGKPRKLEHALDGFGFDTVFVGARRNEQTFHSSPCIFSVGPAKMQRPEPWRLYNARRNQGESARVLPLSNWTELDIWRYIQRERIAVVPLYFATQRPTVIRDGALTIVDADRMPSRPGERPKMKMVRFRSLGGYPLTGVFESSANTVPRIIEEIMEARTSRPEASIVEDRSSASTNGKKQEGNS